MNKETIEIIPIMEKSLNNRNSIFYAGFSMFPKNLGKLPIGIIDLSGDGKMMLEAIKSANFFDNISGEYGKDNVKDLEGESFEIVSDLANFPYSSYLKNEKKDLYRELRESKDGKGNPIYKSIISDNVQIINPFEMVVYECYKELRDSSNLALNIYQTTDNFYVSVSTLSLTSDLTDSLGNFKDEYKMNRECGCEEITFIFLPFSERYIHNTTNNELNASINTN